MALQRIFPFVLLIGTALITTSLCASENVSHGEKLHQQQCVSCHDSKVYTRHNHFVTNLDGLNQQVRRCEVPSTVHWTDEDISAVVTYLNSHFYHFPTR